MPNLNYHRYVCVGKKPSGIRSFGYLLGSQYASPLTTVHGKPDHITYLLKTLHWLISWFKKKKITFLNSTDKFLRDLFLSSLYFLISHHLYLHLKLQQKRSVGLELVLLFHNSKHVHRSLSLLDCLIFSSLFF